MAQSAHPEMLVSTAWVAQHRDDPQVRIVEADEDVLLYDVSHIPGAAPRLSPAVAAPKTLWRRCVGAGAGRSSPGVGSPFTLAPWRGKRAERPGAQDACGVQEPPRCVMPATVDEQGYGGSTQERKRQLRNGWWSIVVGGVVGALLWAGPVGMGSLLGGWMLGAVGVAQADTLCKPAGSLPQSKCTKDAQCCAGLVCEARQCQAGCHIGGSFYASGAINATQCQSCQPAVSTTAWTNLPADTACSDGTACTYNDVCSAAGVCGGTAITCTGDQCTDSACNGTAFCTETPKQDGTGCDDGNPCTTGDTCEAGICAGAPDHTLCLRADRTLGGTACHHRQTGRRSMVPDRVFP